MWSSINKKSPNCVQMKCICHSFNICIEHAFSMSPSNIGFLLTGVPLRFSNSAIREDIKALFQVMNPADEENREERDVPPPFQKLSQTRWLAKGKIWHSILVNQEELLDYHNTCEAKLCINVD